MRGPLPSPASSAPADVAAAVLDLLGGADLASLDDATLARHVFALHGVRLPRGGRLRLSARRLHRTLELLRFARLALRRAM